MGSAWAGLGDEAKAGLPVGQGRDRPTPCPLVMARNTDLGC